jgi:hypothetical protein
LSVCPFSFGYCFAFPSSIYDFCLPLWCLKKKLILDHVCSTEVLVSAEHYLVVLRRVWHNLKIAWQSLIIDFYSFYRINIIETDVSVMKFKYNMYNVQDSLQQHCSSGYMWGCWHFIRMWKRLAWSHHFSRKGDMVPWN